MRLFASLLLSFAATAAFAYPAADTAGNFVKADGCTSAACLTTASFKGGETCAVKAASAGANSYGWYPLSTQCNWHSDDFCQRMTPAGRNPANTQKCCLWFELCNANGELLSDEELLERLDSNREDALKTVFAPQSPETVDAYWGYYSANPRSPNAGRTTSIKARLDICIGETDVDTAVANGVSWCQNTGCGAAANEYCEAYGTNNGQTNVFAAVCKDRCECMINGTTSSTCDQL
jgi:hypothetical protein